MVIPGKDRGSGPKVLPKPARGDPTAARTHPSARSRTEIPAAVSQATDSNDEPGHSGPDVPEAAVPRKSRRLQNTKGKKLRRSSRILNRKHPSNMFDGLSPSVPRSNLNAVSSIRTKRRLVLNNLSPGSLCIISPSAKNWPLVTQMNLPDLEEDTGDEMPAKDQDSDCGQSVDAKTSRASTLYNESRDNDLLRGSLRISAFGPNITLSQGLRARPSPWLPRAETDSDSNHSNVDCPPRWRPLNDRLRFGAELLNADPMDIDQTVGFESIGGLSDHITALKETVVFPLLYHEFFEKFKMTPPRGCLFHGPPGTGKTLVARALANECSHGSRKVSFFMRKGADCMTKWVGESERQLRLLFEQAYQMRPSIIFFDEIDALAPVRSNRQDQVHSSIVCTLLALMDGLNSRGEVVVIGATNRLDAIDPALRRTGRFDREFLFPLPDQEARKDILKIYTRQWSPALSDDTLEELAVHCVGYSGADLRGLCMEATFCALRRRYPQIYGTSLKLQLDLSSLSVTAVDFLSAMKMINPTSQLCSSTPARPLSAIIAPLLSTALQGALERLKRIFPQVTANKNNKSSPGLHDDPVMGSPLSKEESQISLLRPSAVRSLVCHRPRLLLVGRPGSGQSSHLAPALLHALEAFSVHSLEISVLNGNSSVTAEEACTQAFMGARRSAPSVLYLPHLQQWWDTAEEALRSSFLSLLQGITPSCPVLLLATSDTPLNLLHPKIQALFHEEYGEVLSLSVPSEAERRAFFQDLILRQAAETLPPASSPPPPEVLPLAPPPPPRQLTEYERRLLEEKEEDTLRELRLYLRHVTERLCYDRRFKVFTKPMEAKKVRKYQRGIKKPMNLSTLLTNIDKQRYNTVSEFMDDADLIWQNVLKFNPDGGAIERNTRHRAFALKDTLHAIIREDLDKDFERQCQGIRSRRLKRALDLDSDPENNMQKRRRRGRRSKWSSGVLPKPKRKKLSPLGYNSSSSSSQTEHSDGDAPESESSLAPQGSVQSLILQPPESSHTPKPESIAATPTKPAVTPTKPKTTAARPPKSKTTATKSTKSKTTAARPPKSKTTATKSTKAKTTATKSTKSKTTATKSSKSKTTATKHKKSKTTSAKSTKSKTTTAKSTKSKTTTAKPTKSKTTSARSTKSKSTATKPTKSKSTAARATKSKSTAARAPKSKSTAARAPKSKTTPGRPPKSKTQKCTRSQTIRPVRPKVSKQQAVSKRRPSVAEKRSHSEKVERVKKMNDKKQKNLKLDMNSGANTDAAQVDPRQLQELLQFVVVQTDGAEVEHLEKVYTAMAQCINSHRGNSNKSQLIEDLKTLCSRSAAPPESFGE